LPGLWIASFLAVAQAVEVTTDQAAVARVVISLAATFIWQQARQL
jgi:hypothetical protein